MMKGFTLLELIIVIIIIGVLATLGFVQYSALIEKARGAEARQVITAMRSLIIAKSMEGAPGPYGANYASNVPGGYVPPVCVPTNYFRYGMDASCGPTACTFTATRCTIGEGGKTPGAASPGRLQLVWGVTGTDTWTSDAGY